MEEKSSAPKKRQFVMIDYADEEARKKIFSKEEKMKDITSAFDEEKLLYEAAFEQAPKSIKTIVQLATQKEPLADFYKVVILVGSPGSGKSTLAQAIAYKLGKKVIFQSARLLLESAECSPAEIMQQVLEKAWQSGEKSLVILDDIDKILTEKTFKSDRKIAQFGYQLKNLLDKYERGKVNFNLLFTATIPAILPLFLRDHLIGNIFEVASQSRILPQ